MYNCHCVHFICLHFRFKSVVCIPESCMCIFWVGCARGLAAFTNVGGVGSSERWLLQYQSLRVLLIGVCVFGLGEFVCRHRFPDCNFWAGSKPLDFLKHYWFLCPSGQENICFLKELLVLGPLGVENHSVS